jgi:hypothetical protein
VHELQCLLGARRLDEPVAERLQVPLKQAQHVRIIVDDQYRWHRDRWKMQAQADLAGRIHLDVQATPLHLQQPAAEGKPRAIVHVDHGIPWSLHRPHVEIHVRLNVLGGDHDGSTGAGFDDPA